MTEGVLRYELGGLVFGGAYTSRGLFSEFYGNMVKFENVGPLLASLPKQSTVISLLTMPLIHWISIVTT